VLRTFNFAFHDISPWGARKPLKCMCLINVKGYFEDSGEPYYSVISQHLLWHYQPCQSKRLFRIWRLSKARPKQADEQEQKSNSMNITHTYVGYSLH